jgi:EAL domain-containing protein (putative c-di-GMP-specific phosphodiesterase class I)
MRNPEETRTTLRNLKPLGVRIAIDDFRTATRACRT